MRWVLILIWFHFGFAQPQNEPGKLIIDKKLEKKFFKKPPIRVGSTINSYIKDVNRAFPLFDTCRSYFLKDTLIIEFTDITSFYRNRLKLKIINSKYYPYYIKENKEYEATPVSLKFRKRIKRKGQEIIGELEIDFQEPNTSFFQSLKGPFRCTVE